MAAVYRIFVNVISCFLMMGSAASSIPPKTVNLAMETSFLFEPRDMQQNITILTSVRKFMDKLESILAPKAEGGHIKSAFRVQEKDHALTNFLSDLGVVVINYDDEDVTSLAAALSAQVLLTYKTNPTLKEMFKDTKTRMFIKNTLREWSTTDPLKLKVEIAKYVINTEESVLTTFFSNLNVFFNTDEEKFRDLLKKFVKAKKTKQFSKPLEKTIKFIIDGYNKLDDSLKTQFQDELDKLSVWIAVNYPDGIVKSVVKNKKNDDTNEIEKDAEVSETGEQD